MIRITRGKANPTPHASDADDASRSSSFFRVPTYDDPNATLGDLRESVDRFEKTARMAQRALGSAHPEVVNAGKTLQSARAALAARERQSPADAS